LDAFNKKKKNVLGRFGLVCSVDNIIAPMKNNRPTTTLNSDGLPLQALQV
jgi:hypothetical protein